MRNTQVGNRVEAADPENILPQLSRLRWLGRVAYGEHLPTVWRPNCRSSGGVEEATWKSADDEQRGMSE